MNLNKEQIKALSEITAGAGQVFLATIVIPFALQIDRNYPTVLISGLVLTFGSWALTLFLRR